MNLLRLSLHGAWLVVGLLAMPLADPESWTDTGPGFAAGALGNAGQNL